MKRKVALITGISGQDGSYLAELLLEKNYEVCGIVRRSTNETFPNLVHIKKDIKLYHSDLSDTSSMRSIIQIISPNEIYNLASQSNAMVSFTQPEYTVDINSQGVLRLLNIIRDLGFEHKTKFFQASTSEMFGLVQETPQTETTIFYPRSPYGCAKVFAHYITKNYRESYNIFACNGILFNHESPRRGELFVTKKITSTLGRIAKGSSEILILGNIDSKRDWGHAKDYVRAMWLMLQHDTPDDYIISSGKAHSVREFCNISAQYYGISLYWSGSGINEIATDDIGNIIIKISSEFYRPSEVDLLLGDNSKSKEILDWSPSISFSDLVHEMCEG